MARKLNDWISGYLELYKESEPPTVYKEWMALSTIAAAMERRVYLEWEGRIYPNLFVILVGPSGECRKGLAMSQARVFMRAIGANLSADKTSLQAIIRHLTEVTSQYTINGIPEEHSALTIFSPEFTVFLGYENHDLIDVLLDWYDCRDPWTYDTLRGGVEEVRGLWVNMVGATTRSLIQRSLPRSHAVGGLLSRLLLVYADKSSGIVEFPADLPELDALRRSLLSDLSSMQMLRGGFEYGDSFRSVYGPWYRQHRNDMPFKADPHLSSYDARRQIHLLKLSMLICASETDDMIITGDHITRAAEILSRTEIKMPLVFQGFGDSQMASVTSRIMETLARRGTVMRSELLSSYHQDLPFGYRSLDDIISSLRKMDFVDVEIKGSDLCYTVNKKHRFYSRYIL